ncbi:MAG: hypothetical protein AXW15_13630 [Neptuniibacter sp. Phe_28]|nr:MAG: hypothetical protein AXW15_13630 [Neptuniibacter sp. Phe_28]
MTGDLLFGRTSLILEGVGDCLLVEEVDDSPIFESNLFRIRFDLTKACPRFYFYYFQSILGKQLIQKIAKQTAAASITASDLIDQPVPYFDVVMERRISAFIYLFDKKIQLNRETNKTLEQMAQALFKSWFVDFDPVIDNALAAGKPIPEELQARAQRRQQQLAKPDHQPLPDEVRQLFPSEFEETEELGWVPKGWEATTFGQVSICFDKNRVPLSKKQREEKKPGTIPYYGATSVMDHINEWIFDDIYLLIGEDGSVIKEDGSPFVQYVWGKTWVNNHAHVLQGNDGISTEHIMIFMQSQDINAYVTGAVQLKINQGNLNRIPFLKATNDLNCVFAEKISSIYCKVRQVSETINSLTKLRDTLLPKLISGELRLPESLLDSETNPPESAYE